MSILFINGDNKTDGGSLELDGASFITSADVGGTTYVFVAGAADNGISVFALSRSGVLTNTDNVTDSGSLNLTGVSGLTTITSAGNTYLVAAGPGDSGLSVFRVSTAGALTNVYNLADSASYYLSGVSRVTSATVGGVAYVFAAGTNEDGISVFKVTPEGALVSVANVVDNGTYELDGVKGLTTAVVGTNTYLFAAGYDDDGVSVFQVGSDGSLTHTSSFTDNATYKLDGASEVATGVVGGTTYLFVSGAVDNGVTVFSVSTSGVLTYVTNVSDSASLRLAGAAGLAVSTFGANSYLTVGGTESGVSLFKINAGGTLTFVDNIDDGGSRELAGTTMLHTASAGGVNYVLAAGSTDDGVSTLGMKSSGQLWFTTNGGGADSRVVRINSDGSGQTINVDNSSSTKIPVSSSASSTLSSVDVAVDTATGVYFIIVNDTYLSTGAQLLRGVIGSSTAPVRVDTFADGDLVNAMQIDAANRKIYVGYQEGNGDASLSGIKVLTYDATGAITNTAWLVKANADGRASDSTYDLLDPNDFALDPTMGSAGQLFYTEMLFGGDSSVGLFRIDLASNTTTQVVKQTQFPDAGTNGYIYDVEVDRTTDLIYFTTRSLNAYNPSSPSSTDYVASQNALWYISENASGSTDAVKVTLSGAIGTYFYPSDMTFDQATRQLYIESTEQLGSGSDDVIYVFQLDSAGTTATLINTIYPSPALSSSNGNIGGLAFAQLVNLGVSGTSTAAVEQNSTATTLLTGSPTITDTDGGYLTGATVQITGGKFSSNESSTSDDHLGFGSGKAISGTVLGNISISWDATTETLTLTGLDTIANYQSVLSQLVYWTTGDNPTNYGLNTNRTITWTVSDGTLDVPAGSANSATSTLTITGVNDKPVNGTVSSATGNQGTDIPVTGLQISDVDANPALQTFTVTLAVTKGVLTLLTNVSGGLTSGEITNNGTATVTINGTLDEINATLAATNGLLFHGNISGTDTLTVTTSDGGGAGTGGAQTDTDNYTITIIAVNDAPTVTGTTETLGATNEDVANTALTNTVSSLFSSHYGDTDGDAFAGVAVTANGSSGSTGQWQYYNGSTWVNIGTASASSSVLLSASTALRFNPATDFNGAAPTLTVRLVDSSAGGITNGTVVNTSTNGGSTVYSSGTVDLSHTVTAVNDAPTVINGTTVSLTSVAEDSTPGAGNSITSLFSSHFSDAKDTVSGGSSANGFTGVAVTGNAASAAQGVYQYFDGSTWQDIPTVSAASAFVIDASTAVRFVPAADYFGTAPALTVSMIDDSSGAVSTGQSADLTTVGGSTPYSTAMTLNIVVTAVNDAPVATGSATLASINEDTSSPSGATVGSLFGANFSDVDGDTLAGVALTGNAATGSEGVWQFSTDSGTNWTTIGSPSLTTSIILPTTALLRFVPSANYNGAAPALTAHLIDSSGGALGPNYALANTSTNGGTTHYSAASVDLTTTIDAVNDAPSVPSTTGALMATEQTAGILLPTLSISDVDLDARNGGFGNYAGSSFAVKRGVANADDSFDFDTSGGVFTVSGANLQVSGQTIGTFTNTGGVLTINFTSTAAAATTSLVNYIIEHITYTNTSDAPPSLLSLGYTFNDGGGQGTGGALSGSGSMLVSITAVNDPHTGDVVITGSAVEEQTLTADTSGISDPDGIGGFSYAWERSDGSGFNPIAGATSSTYTPDDADIGYYIRVVVSYTDMGNTPESSTSAPTAQITAVNDAPTGAVTISGTTTEDQVLTADTSAVADVDGLGPFSYDWQRSSDGTTFTSIGASDQATYTLGDADVGKYVRVVIHYTDGQGFSNEVDSAGTAQILGVNDPHTGGVSMTGTETEDQTLTVTSTMADVDGIGALHYSWERSSDGSTYTPTGAADQNSYILGDADVGYYVRVVVSYTDDQGFTESETSNATSQRIAAVNDMPTGGVSITGTTTEDQVLTADTSTLGDVDGLGTLHYNWQRSTDGGSNYTSIGAADQATYTLDDPDVNAKIRVVVTYTDGQGFSETIYSGATAVVTAVNDPHTGGVSISGTATEDQVLTADTSTLADVDGLGTLHYSWERSSDNVTFATIGAADQATYTLGDADVNQYVRVVVSYTDNQGFSETTTSSATTAVVNVNDAPLGGISISGTTTEDQTLTAVTSSLTDADGLGTLHYQWTRGVGGSQVNIGTDQATYTLDDADVGQLIGVKVTYVDGHGTSETVTIVGTNPIDAVNDPHTGGVSISGTTTEDQVLTAVSTLADVDGLGTLHYSWERSSDNVTFSAIGAADQATYTLGDADVDQYIRVVVSYTDGQGFSEATTSAATVAITNVNDLPTGAVAISGTATEFQTLTADTSALADNDGLGTLHYQWEKDDQNGGGYVALGAADQSTYTLTTADIGGKIRVVITYTDDHGTAEQVISSQTATIIPANAPHTGTVTVSGTTTEDQTLTAVSTMADTGGLGTLHYDWQRSSDNVTFTSIGAADLATYTLGDADVDKFIRVYVSYTDGQGVFEDETSASVGTVANVNDAPTGAVTITGTIAEDSVVTANTSTLADADGLGVLHYRWQRGTGSSFSDIGAADQATYTPGDADVGLNLRVIVSYIDGHGTAQSVTSGASAAVANVNDPPVAVNDTNSVIQRQTATGTVLTNDSDIDNATSTLVVSNIAFNTTHVNQAVSGSGGTVVQGAYGALTIFANGTYSYVANQENLTIGQVVTDKFDYTIKDPDGATASAQLTVTITGSATGDANANTIISDGNAHTLTGRGGADTLTGGGGADTFNYEAISDSTPSAYDTITDFTHNADLLKLTPLITNTTKVTLTTDGATGANKIVYIDQNGDGSAEGQILSLGLGLEVTDIVTGVANFGFTLNGWSGSETLTGGTGDDLIFGYGGNDVIRGGLGQDILSGGSGADRFVFGAGESSLTRWDVVVDFETGVDKLDVSAADGGVITIAKYGSSTFLYYGNASTGYSALQVVGDIAVDDLITSSAVHGVTIYGSFGTETLRGGSGADVLVAGTGTTTLIGGAGGDALYGGSGADTFRYTAVSDSTFSAWDSIVGFGYGVDKLDISAIDGGKITIARYAGTTFVYTAPDSTGNFQAVIAVSGTELKSSDLIVSGGATQSFTIVGDGASHNVADTLVGGAGNDILYGLDGNDTLTGGGGADFMLGGSGADTFVYTAVTDSLPYATDLIYDFSHSDGDKIDLSAIDANTNTAANDAFSVVTSFSGVAGQLILSAPDASGYYHLSGDVNGDRVADFVIAVNAIGTLTTADLIL